MRPTEFEVQFSSNGEAVLTPRGEIDVATAPAFRTHLDEAIAAGRPRVVVDFTTTEFLDSTGIGELVRALKRLRSDGRELVMRSPQGVVLRALELTGMTKVIPVED